MATMCRTPRPISRPVHSCGTCELIPKRTHKPSKYWDVVYGTHELSFGWVKNSSSLSGVRLPASKYSVGLDHAAEITLGVSVKLYWVRQHELKISQAQTKPATQRVYAYTPSPGCFTIWSNTDQAARALAGRSGGGENRKQRQKVGK
ncbi:hypothetical protein B0H13DRAFT_1858781 [Mycena leptocephala]|nr:hypothetical protein B0H13DRAFT_1858781 [Mycena leptocephala]